MTATEMMRWKDRRGYIHVNPNLRVGVDILDVRLHPWTLEIQLQVSPMMGTGSVWLPMRMIEISQQTLATTR